MRQVLGLAEFMLGLDEIRSELELPESCHWCGLSNLKIWGTRTNGRLVVEVRCMRCGKPLSKVERLE
ncbi:hypothetical protein ES703_40768 [subsurface metagenome]